MVDPPAHRFHIYFPRWLYDKMKERAHEKRLSVAGYIRETVEKDMEEGE